MEDAAGVCVVLDLPDGSRPGTRMGRFTGTLRFGALCGDSAYCSGHGELGSELEDVLGQMPGK